MATARRRVHPVLTIAIVAGLAVAGYYGWQAFHSGAGVSHQASAAAPRKVPVTAAEVRTADFPVYLNGLGNVQSLNSVVVRSRVAGAVEAVNFKEGQIVHQGDLLAQLDPRPLQAALDQANAKLAQDQSSLADARANLQRYQELAQREFASRQQLDTQAATVKQGEAQVRGDEAAIKNAQTQLDYAAIRAPMTGQAGFRLVDVGNIVNTADTGGIVTIQQTDPIGVVFTAPEGQLQAVFDALKAGKPTVIAQTSDGATTLATGTLTIVNNEVDTTSGTIRLKAEFANPDFKLWPGLSVTTRLLLRTVPDALVVSSLAVQHGPNGLFVYVVGEGDKAALRKITVAGNEAGLTQVTSGLSAGERVVTEGAYRVQPGTVVDAKMADAPPSEKVALDAKKDPSAAKAD